MFSAIRTDDFTSILYFSCFTYSNIDYLLLIFLSEQCIEFYLHWLVKFDIREAFFANDK